MNEIDVHHWCRSGLVVTVVAALLLSGCSSGEGEPQDPTTPSPQASPTPSMFQWDAPPFSPATEPTIDPDEPRFAVELPDPLCPPVTALTSLDLTDPEPYELENATSGETNVFGRYLRVGCTYKRPDIGEHDVELEDHFLVIIRAYLHEDVGTTGVFGRTKYEYVLPVDSTSLLEWREATFISVAERAWREGCESATPCPEGEQPTVHNRRLRGWYEGRVGNVEFEGRISYIAEEIPDDALKSSLAVFRDYVLAFIDQLERTA
jgi:hypothetical protein